MNPGLLILGAAILGAAGVGGYLFFRPRQAAEEAYYHFQCPKCQRKLRYRMSKAGHQGMCPRCRTPCTFPMQSSSFAD